MSAVVGGRPPRTIPSRERGRVEMRRVRFGDGTGAVTGVSDGGDLEGIPFCPQHLRQDRQALLPCRALLSCRLLLPSQALAQCRSLPPPCRRPPRQASIPLGRLRQRRRAKLAPLAPRRT